MPHNSANKSAPGWHSRGYLPHWDSAGVIQSVTFRLADSVPSEVIEEWKRELKWEDAFHADSSEARELRRRIAAYEDSGHDDCFLRRPEIAKLVQDALLHFDGDRYALHAWCVMPNHVHVVLRTGSSGSAGILPGNAGVSPASDDPGRRDACVPGATSLAKILHSRKSYTAHQANRILGRTEADGPFWLRESFDRFIRDEHHHRATLDYIHNNPVKARLCARPEDWPWSSAYPENARLLPGNAGVPPARPSIQHNAGETPAFPV